MLNKMVILFKQKEVGIDMCSKEEMLKNGFTILEENEIRTCNMQTTIQQVDFNMVMIIRQY